MKGMVVNMALKGRFKRARRAMEICALALLCLLSSACYRGGKADSGNNAAASVKEVSLAVGKDCPPGVVDVLNGLGDDAARISGGAVQVNLQHWADPLSSGADLCFVLSEPLAEEFSELGPLRMDYLFSTYAHMSAAMNAQAVLDFISEQLRPDYALSAYSTFYYGRKYLLAGENEFSQALRADDTKRIDGAVKDIVHAYHDAMPVVQPAAFDGPPEKDTIYFADTQLLSTVDAQSTQGYTLIDANYRYQFGVFCISDHLSERLTQAEMAAIFEAAAVAKPACDNAHLEKDVALHKSFSSVITPSLKLRRAVRERQNMMENSPNHSALYQMLDNYST